MMGLFKILRHAEWWEYKLPPLLGIAYATLLINHKNIFEHAAGILVVLASLIVGAAYVSIINDITDIEVDLAAGKSNRMAGVSPVFRILLPLLCLVLGGCFIAFFYWPDRLSTIFYLMPWILFSMYSFPPLRLKNRGILGVGADAGGSHLFTSLLMVSSTSFAASRGIPVPWLAFVGLWAFCYGVRGILWHQFHDRDNDIQSGIPTFATQRSRKQMQLPEVCILIIELIATVGILLQLNLLVTYLGAAFYLMLVLVRRKYLKRTPVIILAPPRAYQILMLDFMQVIFPLSLLLYASFTQTNGWIVLIAHLVLFPFKTIQVIKDCRLFSLNTTI